MAKVKGQRLLLHIKSVYFKPESLHRILQIIGGGNSESTVMTKLLQSFGSVLGDTCVAGNHFYIEQTFEVFSEFLG